MKKIHESASVSNEAIVGEGTSIWQNCIIQEDVEIGNNCNIGANVFVEQGVKIGNGVKIKNNIAIYKGVIVEDDVFIGPNAVFTNVINPRAFIDRKQEFKQTIICKGASIGANATIICGNTIGRYAMIGAGTVIVNNVEDYELVVGNPQRRIGFVCECGCKVSHKLKCISCGKEYQRNKNSIMLKGQ